MSVGTTNPLARNWARGFLFARSLRRVPGRVPRAAMRLALGVLLGFARFFQPSLLAFLFAGVAREEVAGAEGLFEGFICGDERAGESELDGSGLTRRTAAFDFG